MDKNLWHVNCSNINIYSGYDEVMRWIDIITLRSSTTSLESLNNEVLLSIINNMPERSLKGSKIYRRYAMDSDLSIHLFWDSENIEQKENILVQHLIQFLKQYGLVNHSIWVEQDRQSKTYDSDRRALK